MKDHPYSLLVETCSRAKPRTLSPWRIIALIVPNLLNFASLCTDILLVRFLHKTVLPTITLKLEKSNSNCKPEPEISTSNRQAYGHSEPSTCGLSTIEPEGKSANISVVQESAPSNLNPETQAQKGWYQKLKSWNPLSHIQGPERIPIRVSLMSSMLVFPFIGVHLLCTLLRVRTEQRTYASLIGLAVSNTLRCPLTVMMAFKSTTKPIIRKKDDHQNGFPMQQVQNDSSDSETI